MPNGKSDPLKYNYIHVHKSNGPLEQHSEVFLYVYTLSYVLVTVLYCNIFTIVKDSLQFMTVILLEWSPGYEL